MASQSSRLVSSYADLAKNARPRTAVLSAMDDYGEQLPNAFPLTIGFNSDGEYVEIHIPEILQGIADVASKCGQWKGQLRIVNFGNMRFLNWLRVERVING